MKAYIKNKQLNIQAENDVEGLALDYLIEKNTPIQFVFYKEQSEEEFTDEVCGDDDPREAGGFLLK